MGEEVKGSHGSRFETPRVPQVSLVDLPPPGSRPRSRVDVSLRPALLSSRHWTKGPVVPRVDGYGHPEVLLAVDGVGVCPGVSPTRDLWGL